ncbi:putative flavin-containing monooxygenase [Ilyonectria sp. MPI-CAGE-AT-0026]|nr:putative flavin-containing monooxygenase [Ilyonectria sp. MPI-CAGE-AT-0026]
MAISALENLGGNLPVAQVPEGVNTEVIFTSFQGGLGHLDASFFKHDAIYRDMFALTDSSHTYYGVDTISVKWHALVSSAKAKRFRYLTKSAQITRLGESNWIEGTYTFEAEESPARICTAILTLILSEDGKWRIWILRTFLDRLQDHPSVDEYNPPPRENGSLASRRSHSRDQTVFDCVVVGAGQAGLSVAGRLKSQGIDYVVLEKNKSVGDNWRNRYCSTKLHTTRESSHLPFDRTFPPHYPQYLTKNDLAQGYSDWAEKFQINTWVGTTVVSGHWNESQKIWTLELISGNEPKTITATHLVMCVGAGCQIPYSPTYPGVENYRGVIQHSAHYTTAGGWQGKHGIVVGTANTAHDVAEDMVAAGLKSVTMIQRSPTYVLPAEYYSKVQDLTWTADIPTTLADQQSITLPLVVNRHLSMLVLNGMARTEPGRFDALDKAGFKCIRYGDIIYHVFGRFGGHYMDVGGSAKIAKGLIKIKSDAYPVAYTSKGLLFSDDTELEAHAIVFATGFVGSMKFAVREILGSKVADRMEDFWGIDVEGEIRGSCRPCGQPNLWMNGGTCSYARYMSRFIALQVRADLDGTPLNRGSASRETGDTS